MSEEAEKTLIPEDESADVLKETPVHEGVATEEKAGEQKNEAGKVSEERIRLENEAYEKHFAALESAGDLEVLENGAAILRNTALYSGETGLSLEADSGKALFV